MCTLYVPYMYTKMCDFRDSTLTGMMIGSCLTPTLWVQKKIYPYRDTIGNWITPTYILRAHCYRQKSGLWVHFHTLLHKRNEQQPQTRQHIHQRYYASTPPRRHSHHLHNSLRETNIVTYSGTTSNIRTSLHSYTTRTPSHTRNIYLMDTDILYTDSEHTHLLLQRHIVTDSSTRTPEKL